jgi:hypothetical protein
MFISAYLCNKTSLKYQRIVPFRSRRSARSFYSVERYCLLNDIVLVVALDSEIPDTGYLLKAFPLT